jgi:hypothetical protein
MKKNLLVMAALALLAGPMAAQAIPMRLDATSQNSNFSNFFVEFDDTGDHLLQFNEVTVFSGITFTSSGRLYSILLAVPEIPGFATGGCRLDCRNPTRATCDFCECNSQSVRMELFNLNYIGPRTRHTRAVRSRPRGTGIRSPSSCNELTSS